VNVEKVFIFNLKRQKIFLRAYLRRMLRSFTADYVFPIAAPPVRDGIVVADDSGAIVGVFPHGEYAKADLPEKPAPEKHAGFLCPGFINAHCHLELSHLKGRLAQGITLPGFIGEVIGKRNMEMSVIEKAIENAEDEMIAGGIVAAGDICNTADTIKQKKKKRIRYHNFIELFDIDPSQSEKEFEKGIALQKQFIETGCTSSLTPHAPYTVSPQLLKRLYVEAYRHDSILSLHNQETESENEMFRSRSGALFEKLSSFGSLYERWQPTGFSSLASTLVHLPRCNKTLLVHNTYSTPEDVNWAQLYSQTIYWCFCPNANMFIENRLPDFKIFIDGSCRMLVGTDSYAGNRSLSVLEELKTISKYAPKIRLENMLRWATLNGADFFGWKKDLGSLEKGKRPGLNLLTGVQTETLSLTSFSEVKPLIKA
jgi:aminodeoxyfutalosine deaminase